MGDFLEKKYDLILGDSLEVLKKLDDNSIQCCITSPPYYALRNYGIDNQIGLEKTPQEYVNNLVKIFMEVKRILKPNGTLWLNLGDSYNSHSTGKGNVGGIEGKRKNKQDNVANTFRKYVGVKNKDLLGIPWMVAFALRDNVGFYLRSDIVWGKPNPMPESVKDRPTRSHEYIFLLTKNDKYYYDYESILEPAVGFVGKTNMPPIGGKKHVGKNENNIYSENIPEWKQRGFKTKEQIENPQYHGSDILTKQYRNKRDVWVVAPARFKKAHFATFPEKLIEPCVLAGTKENDIILDPFSGSGMTGVVAIKNNRKYIGIDINPEYIQISKEEIEKIKSKL